MWAAPGHVWWCARSKTAACDWWERIGRVARMGEGQDLRPARGHRDGAGRAVGSGIGGRDQSVESVVMGMGGPTVRGANSRGVLEMGFVREIDQRDINRVVDRATRVRLQEDRMLLQLFPQDFVVDDHPGHRDPRKMEASRLEINVHLVMTSMQEHTTLVTAVNHAHLLVEETIFEGLAACYAAVLPEERRQGIAVIDIGSQSTELVVYYGDAMHLASTVKVCGDHFTRDLAQGLCLSFEDAELVKLEYGCAMSDATPENVMVDLPTPENREHRHAPRRFVNEILQARAEELFRFVRSELARVGHGACADRRRVSDRRRQRGCRICATSPSACCSARRVSACRAASSTGRRA